MDVNLETLLDTMQKKKKEKYIAGASKVAHF